MAHVVIIGADQGGAPCACEMRKRSEAGLGAAGALCAAWPRLLIRIMAGKRAQSGKAARGKSLPRKAGTGSSAPPHARYVRNGLGIGSLRSVTT